MGPKGAAALLRKYPTLEDALAAGRFPQQAQALLLYKRIATMDASAPIPPLDNQAPTWGRAADLCREWGLDQLAARLSGLAAG